jgi:hypothetical protein
MKPRERFLRNWRRNDFSQVKWCFLPIVWFVAALSAAQCALNQHASRDWHNGRCIFCGEVKK